jgi:site-specific recombinase XerD
MLLHDAVTELLLARDYTPQTAAKNARNLREFTTWATAQGITATEQVTAGTVRRYLAYLRERPNQRWGKHLSGVTQHSHAGVVRTFLRFCAREGYVNERVVTYFDMPRRPRRVIHILTPAHYGQLVAAADHSPFRWLRLRDKALLAVLFDAGIRAEEACKLTRDAVFLTPGASYLHILVKGRAEREVGIGRQASLALHRWLTRGTPSARAQWSAHTATRVFLNKAGQPMTPNGLDKLLYRLVDVAGPEHFVGVRVSAHTFRHTYAVRYMEQGGDIYKLSRLMGHENIQTTTRYLNAFQARDARLSSRSVLDGLK